MWWRQSRRSVRRRALQERGRAREAGGAGRPAAVPTVWARAGAAVPPPEPVGMAAAGVLPLPLSLRELQASVPALQPARTLGPQEGRGWAGCGGGGLERLIEALIMPAGHSQGQWQPRRPRGLSLSSSSLWVSSWRRKGV